MNWTDGAVPTQNLGRVELTGFAPSHAPHNLAHSRILMRFERPGNRPTRVVWLVVLPHLWLARCAANMRQFDSGRRLSG